MFFNDLFDKQKVRNYEFYNKGYGLRKHPRVILTLPIELTLCTENRQSYFLEGEAKDISASGLYLKIIPPREELPPLDYLPVKDDLTLQNPISVKVHMTREKPIMEEYDLEGRIVWTSEIVINPEDGRQYIFCGIQFDTELKFSIQLDQPQQLVTSPNKTLEKLVAFYNEDLNAKLQST
ncbi:MAG: PilZ domain-containing protein [Synergistaceae bacterium]|nr:PilZ domain-containing protein [Synergistaceae bacterium]